MFAGYIGQGTDRNLCCVSYLDQGTQRKSQALVRLSGPFSNSEVCSVQSLSRVGPL